MKFYRIETKYSGDPEVDDWMIPNEGEYGTYKNKREAIAEAKRDRRAYYINRVVEVRTKVILK